LPKNLKKQHNNPIFRPVHIMTCEHKNTGVVETRSPDYTSSKGRRRFRKFDFPVLVIRIRKCFDCNERFLTTEVRMDDLSHMIDVAKKSRISLAEDILKFLKEQMP